MSAGSDTADGGWLDHAAIERLIDEALGLPDDAQLLAAERRMQRSIAVPDVIEVRGADHLGVA